MDNLMTETIIKRDVMMASLASFLLLVGDPSSQCFLYFKILENLMAQHHHCNVAHHKWNRIPIMEIFHNSPCLNQDDFKSWLINLQDLYDLVVDFKSFKNDEYGAML
jgi:hypothetical protein